MTKRQTLIAKKDVVLDQLQSLDFEYETGKMPDDVYEAQRAFLMDEASALLKEIDGVGAQRPVKQAAASAADVDDDIEKAIARYRKTAAKGQSANGKKIFCSQCGQPADAGDRFCAGCGHQLLAKSNA